MLQTTLVTARDISRNYKAVFDRVKTTKEPTVVINQKEPQVAIVSMEDLKKLQQLKYKNSAQALFDVAYKSHDMLAREKLPKDLSKNHDYYAWGGKEKNPKNLL